ncbi:MAG: rRNA maturation RNase YbeY [Thermotogaceae bacterium]|nr:rRNA maturation RNase YbeY [Thermotogaceae bacterium]
MRKNSYFNQNPLYINIVEKQRRITILHRGIKHLIRSIAEEEDVSKKASCSVIFIKDPEMREINRLYRGLDEPTDVLSFACIDEIDAAVHLSETGVSGPELGDIFVSVDTMIRNAKEDRQETWVELVSLVVHGFLHLIGYDHQTDAEREEMFVKQNGYIESFVKCGNLFLRERNPRRDSSNKKGGRTASTDPTL